MKETFCFFLLIIFVLFSYRKFSKSIFDVRELFSTDEIAYKSLAKFGNYLREIQTLFSVRNLIYFNRLLKTKH
jgi:hypothetical protein